MAQKLQQQLKELGSKLQTLPTTKEGLIKLLKQAAVCLSELEQSPPAPMLDLMQPFFNAIAKPELLKHQDKDVKLLVATCMCEITRITAPEAPYSDDVLKNIFEVIVGTFSGLSDTNGPSFGRRVFILETLARYRSCVVMLDLECHDLINEMFSTFFLVASKNHPESVLKSMRTIMVVLLEENDDVRVDLLLVILSNLGRNKKDVTLAARKLAMSVIEHCAVKLEPGIKEFLISSMAGDGKSLDNRIDHHEVIYDIYCCAPQILSGVIPYLTGELLNDHLDTRLKAVKLVGDLIALPGSSIAEAFKPIFREFLKRLTDRVVGVRLSVLEHIKSCLLSNPSRVEAPQIISALCDRLLDYDENVRKQVVAVICDVACRALNSIPVETAKLVAERLRDKSLVVKKYTMDRLAEMYKLYCLRCSDGPVNSSEFDWIPGRILRCFYDKDFRSDTIESVLWGSLFPTELSTKDKVKHWVRVFSGFDKVEVKALEKMLEQKQRLQQEMQKYMSLRQMSKNGDAPEIQKKIGFCFRIMSRWFTDPAKAEEHFWILDQLQDANIWKILTSLFDPNTNFQQACTYRDEMLGILGEKHRLHDFLSILSVKCSYFLFNKDHLKELLLEASIQKSAGDMQYTLSCMNILVILACFSPLLLCGFEEDLVNLLKDGNEIIKEGVLHVLAKAGGTIREQLAMSSSSVDLILERLCLEGNRRQAKYAVHALAAITKDDGLKSLSVLYKSLVDMLEEEAHLPAVLQSLGCIAQTAMPVFETRESEIEEFIKSKILYCSNKAENTKTSWDDRSELCSLKIFGIKTLVKSYLPVKDAHLRTGIDGLLGILKNILLYGEISKDRKSSSVDKAHLRLASAKAVLRLSKYWDHKIPVDLFHLTLRTSEISFPEAKKLFLGKVHQYVKDKVLDPKYVCAFLFNINSSQPSQFEEDKHNLGEIIQIYHQAKTRQLSTQCDASSVMTYPEYILPYLVHALAHHSCPNIDNCKDVKAFELIYRQLHLFISMLVHGGEDGKREGSTNQEKERISVVSSIFQCIKRSEDVVDVAKSKNSYAICDLGLLVAKRLAQKEDNFQDLTSSVSLPPLLYKPHGNKEDDGSLASEGQTWLADESVLGHLESFKIGTPNGIVHSEIADDEGIKDIEQDGSEVPLGKIIKRIKSQGTKARRVMKQMPLPDEVKKTENDVDILKMVRDINLDSLRLPSNFESSNGLEHFPSRKEKLDNKHHKRKRTNTSASVPVPKRRRSSSAHIASKSSSKGYRKAFKDDLNQIRVSPIQSIGMDAEFHPDSENKLSMQKNMANHSESDLLVSCLKKNTSISSKHKGKRSDRSSSGAAQKVKEDESPDPKKPDVLVAIDKINTSSSFKSQMGSTKKRKRRSIAGLAKCTSKEGGIRSKDLIDCRIKVWWPLDEVFYEGVVQSYDPREKRHVILYDDGDIEVLRLEKERWELVDPSPISNKKMKLSKSPQSARVSPVEKKKHTPISPQIKESFVISSPSKGKRTPKKNLKQKQKVVIPEGNFGEAESRGSSDVSNPEPTTSKVDTNSGENVEKVDESLMVKEKSVSKLKDIADTEKSSREFKKVEKHDSKGKSHSKGKESSGVSREAARKEEKIVSEDDNDTESNHSSSSSDTEEKLVFPDDEPLSAWRNKLAGKSRRIG